MTSMKTYTKAELNEILKKHKEWLDNNSDSIGEKADLSGADLRAADLSGADLREADLSGADLREADLSGANLYRANLFGANLYGANLRAANLREANLREANLNEFLIVPETGSFIGYKKSQEGIIIELEIQKDSLRLNSIGSRKCRAKTVKILKFIGTNKRELHSKHDNDFIYKVGDILTVNNFNEDVSVECAEGIHFFITKKEAEDY